MQQKSGEGLQFQAEMASTRPQGQVEPTQPPPPPPQQQQLAETPSPISSRPPPPPGAVNFDELGSAVAGAVGFLDDEEAERAGTSGSRWPKQETLALLKIRSEMVSAFRDATFKGPLWEEISRKLAELGYKRSAKKCKEKFENVHKYYKRTKEGRAGRQDGKTYRFFTQLEALHGRSERGDIATPTAIAAPPITAEPPATFSFATPPMSAAAPAAIRIQPFPISSAAPHLVGATTRLVPEFGQQRLSSSAAVAAAAVAGISFSSNSSFSSSSESDSDEEMAEAGSNAEERKRKRGSTGRPARRQMMAFFEGLMRQVMERQEVMQQRFLEAIEKREQERMKREEAWLLQEMARLSREQEMLVQERAMAASRDAAVISYLQKITGQSITLPTMPSAPTLPLVTSVVPLTSLPSQHPPPPSNPPQPPPSLQKHEAAQRPTTPITIQASPASQLTPISSEPQEGRGPGSGGFDSPASSSRWPKAEVHALIKLRSELESRYQEAGPKGPLWEEISGSMQLLGYSRNAKRCKEKWENINKYFKKVKESNKKRPEDSKTCPYFDQLEALYRRKQFRSAAGGSRSLAAQQQQEHLESTNPTKEHLPLQLHPPPAPPHDLAKNEKTNDGNSDTGGAVQVPTSNGGHTPSFIEEGMKKPEDIVKELIMEQRKHQGMVDVDYDKMEDETDSENLDQADYDDDDDDADDDEDSKKHYKIQFQRPNGERGTPATTTAAASASSFLAMVQ